MYSTLSTLAFTAASFVCSSSAAWNPDRPIVFGNTELSRQRADLLRELPARESSTSNWKAGWIPEYCYNESLTYGLEPSDFEAKNVFYDDCPDPWAICRHKSARQEESWEYVIDTLGRLPVGMRQYMADIVIMPPKFKKVHRGCAWARPFVQASTYTADCLDVGVLVHEMAHILDAVILRNVTTGGWVYSRTVNWQRAYDKDTAVPTNHARSNWQEDFADAGRFALSHMVHPGGLADYSSRWKEIANQIEEFRARFQTIIFPSGKMCTYKTASSKPVLIRG